jgi:hypothetical protein
MWTGWWPGSTSARGPRLARLALLRWRLPAAGPNTPRLSAMPLDLLSRFPGVGARTSGFFATTNILKVGSQCRQRAHRLAPPPRLLHQPGGHVLSLAGWANSIRPLTKHRTLCVSCICLQISICQCVESSIGNFAQFVLNSQPHRRAPHISRIFQAIWIIHTCRDSGGIVPGTSSRLPSFSASRVCPQPSHLFHSELGCLRTVRCTWTSCPVAPKETSPRRDAWANWELDRPQPPSRRQPGPSPHIPSRPSPDLRCRPPRPKPRA